MDELIQFVFIALVIVASIWDGQARKRKQREQREQEGEGNTLPEYSVPHGTTSGDEEFESSESMVPEEFWDDVVQLASGEPAEFESDDGDAIAIEEYQDPMTGSRHPVVVRRETRPAQATDHVSIPPERTIQEEPVLEVEAVRQEPLRVGEAGAAGSGSARQRLFGPEGLSSDGLRRAVLLKEVLGPPVALRKDD